MASKTPHVGRPARIPGAKTPPRVAAATSGSVRQRARADEPWNPTGKAAPPPKQSGENS